MMNNTPPSVRIATHTASGACAFCCEAGFTPAQCADAQHAGAGVAAEPSMSAKAIASVEWENALKVGGILYPGNLMGRASNWANTYVMLGKGMTVAAFGSKYGFRIAAR